MIQITTMGNLQMTQCSVKIKDQHRDQPRTVIGASVCWFISQHSMKKRFSWLEKICILAFITVAGEEIRQLNLCHLHSAQVGISSSQQRLDR